MKKKQSYAIVHPIPGYSNSQILLCRDGHWRSGVCSGLGKLDTLVYKTIKAANKKIDSIIRKSNGKFKPMLAFLSIDL